MTTTTQRERAHRAATQARDELLRSIDDMVPDDWRRQALRQRTERLYSTCVLLTELGDEPVYPTLQTKLEEKA